MALTAPTFVSTRVQQPALDPGSYPALVARVIDLGLQPQVDYTTKEPKKPAHMINVTYELVDAFMVDAEGNEQPDKPRWLSEDFTLLPLSSDLATSTKRYKAIDPQGKHKGDWSKLLGLGCSVVTGNYTTKKAPDVLRDKVLSVTAMRPRDLTTLPEPANDLVFFDLSNPNMEVFNSFPDWLKDKIKSNLEFSGSPLETLLSGGTVKAPAKAAEAPQPQYEEPQGEAADEDAPW